MITITILQFMILVIYLADELSLFNCYNLRTILEEVNNFSEPVFPTVEELNSLSLACDRLWDLDIHRL